MFIYRFKHVVFFILICIIYVLALFVNQKITWSLYLALLMFILFSRPKLVIQPATLLVSLGLPLIWTILLSYNYSFYSNIQGLFYLSIPLIMLLTGYQISKYFDLKYILKTLIYLGTILSLIYIAMVVFKVGFEAFLSPYEKARFVVGSGSPASIMCVIISLYSERYEIKLFRSKILRYLIILINILAIYIFASRTYWVVLFIFLLVLNIKFINRHKLSLTVLILTGALLLIIFPVKISGDITTTRSLVFKIFKTFSEIKFSDYKTYSDINTHYRGYEAYRAFVTFLEGNPLNFFFGHGLGKSIDLKTSVYLAGEYRTIIPWIHNGYFFILVKEGIFGLMALFLFFIQTLNYGLRNFRAEKAEIRFISLLIIGSVFSMALTNYVICSMFTIEMGIILITMGTFIQRLSAIDNNMIIKESTFREQ